MAWWKTKKKNGSGYSYLAEGASVMGRLCFDGIIRLDGRVIGEIISTGTLVVEETAVINGTVVAENMVLSGTILGDIQVYKHVQLNSTARIYGHISYGELSMDGAVHEGRCHKLSPGEITEIQKYCHDILTDAEVEQEDYIPPPELLEQYVKALDKSDKLTAGILNRKAASERTTAEVDLDRQPSESGREIRQASEADSEGPVAGGSLQEKLLVSGLNFIDDQPGNSPGSNPGGDGQPKDPSRRKSITNPKNINDDQPGNFLKGRPLSKSQSTSDDQSGEPSLEKTEVTDIIQNSQNSQEGQNDSGEAIPPKLLDSSLKKITTAR